MFTIIRYIFVYVYTVFIPGLLQFGIFSNFRKNTPKNSTKPGNIPGLLHFF